MHEYFSYLWLCYKSPQTLMAANNKHDLTFYEQGICEQPYLIS